MTYGKVTTGVTFILSCAHADKATGQLHGHTWEVTAWFEFRGADELVQLERMERLLKPLDHTCLPDELAWGESIAQHVGIGLNKNDAVAAIAGACVKVDVIRQSERIFARWEL